VRKKLKKSEVAGGGGWGTDQGFGNEGTEEGSERGKKGTVKSVISREPEILNGEKKVDHNAGILGDKKSNFPSKSLKGRKGKKINGVYGKIA